LPRIFSSPKRGSILGQEVAKEVKVPVKKDVEVSDPVSSFTSWMTLVDKTLELSKKGDSKVVQSWSPPSVGSNLHVKAWGWLLFHFRSIPTIRKAAADFWVDKCWTSDELKRTLERIITEGKENFSNDLLQSVSNDMFSVSEINGYKWVNPSTSILESHCFQKNTFTLCPSNFDTLITKSLGAPVDIKSQTGDLFGFLVPRKDNTIVFKTLDKSNSKRITGAVGADCSVASDLGGHRGRIRDIQNIIRKISPEMKDLMLNDEESEMARDIKGRIQRQESFNFKHIDDLSHIFVCIYMETLLRLMDYKGYTKKRWFLNAVAASRSGLKGR
jgi:hypothetical protein